MDLNSPVTILQGLGAKKKKVLEERGIFTLRDLMYFFPKKYEDKRYITSIGNLFIGNKALISGEVIQKQYRVVGRRNSPLILKVEDHTGIIDIVFFQGMYVNKQIEKNKSYTFYGLVTENMGRLQMAHPEFELVGSSQDKRNIVPIYGNINGISQREMRKWQEEIVPLMKQVEEWLPEYLVSENNLCNPSFALKSTHFPEDETHYKQGKYRLIFEELLLLEAGLFFIRNRNLHKENGAKFSKGNLKEFQQLLPFDLTKDQIEALRDIMKDLKSSKPMNRLIQGDVGSGKTAVAQGAMYFAYKSGFQSVMMAPTELLAKQHFQSFKELFKDTKIKIGLLISNMKTKNKKETLECLKSGDINILIGTHAVISQNVKYKNLGLVITDEQHRFGVNQRSQLSEKGRYPNIMVMTATPIPRTLAVVVYGDLDISLIKSMPKGRIPIKTRLYKDEIERMEALNLLEKELKAGHQAYVVAPLIEESEKIDAKSVEVLYEELKKRFSNYKVGLLHGSMSQEDKDEIMESFSKGKINLLVSTVVIEVGIDVPNATVMLIENGERFGLSQLHQLRGRVGRGKKQSYCGIIMHSKNELSLERGKIMVKTQDGFIIAEEDLRLRGPGDFFGTKQHGLPDLALGDLVKHIEILEKTRKIAKDIIKEDPNLEFEENQGLKEQVQRLYGEKIQLKL